MKVVIVSRLSELLSKLSRTRQMSQIQIVDRSEDLGVPLSKANVSKYLSGKHPEKPSTNTLDKFAQVLDVPLDDLVAAATFTGREPFDLDPASDRLTASQRAVVNEVIRQFADANEKAGDGSEHSATPMNQAGGKPATGEDDGLGAFGGRARGDLDHEDINDGNGDNVYSLVPPPPASDTAAYRAPNRGKKQKDKQDEDAEESQDPGDDDE